MPTRVSVTIAAILWFALSMTASAFDLQAHRGGRGLWPENTLVAFAGSLSLGVTTLELDTGITRDGVVVVSHNPHLSPDLVRDKSGKWLTANDLKIAALTLEQIKQYDVGRLNPGSRTAGRFGKQAPADGATMPTLVEVFALARKAGNDTVRFNIETKINPIKPDLTYGAKKFAQTLVAAIQKAGMQERVSIQSFDWSTLQEIQKIAPDIPTVYLTAQQRWLNNVKGKDGKASAWTAGINIADHNGSVPAMIRAAGGDIWAPFFGDLKLEMVKKAHELDLKVVVWTVNKPEHMKVMIAMGVDGIISDYPDILRQVVKDAGLELPEASPVSP